MFVIVLIVMGVSGLFYLPWKTTQKYKAGTVYPRSNPVVIVEAANPSSDSAITVGIWHDV